MWNTVILPILTSLAATGLGILTVWLFNRKRRDDKIANEISRIGNKIEVVEAKMEAVEAKMDNGFSRERLEKDVLLNAFNATKIEMEQANEKAFLKQRELSQDIIERIHLETIAREESNQIIKTSIDNLEKEVATNKDSINRILGIVENHTEILENHTEILENHTELINRAINN